jgi:methylenetetrahydrofolate reductase (NADPH)
MDELQLKVPPEQVLVHLTTFHVREALDEILQRAQRLGVRYLLVISGDGGERLPKLSPASIGLNVNAVTSVELLAYIRRAYPGVFTCGVAFNPYEPPDHELEKLRRKIDAGAAFICTQPVLGFHERVGGLAEFGLPLMIDAWMSKKLDLLVDCIGYALPATQAYDPVANLKELRRHYPAARICLVLANLKLYLPLLEEIR